MQTTFPLLVVMVVGFFNACSPTLRAEEPEAVTRSVAPARPGNPLSFGEPEFHRWEQGEPPVKLLRKEEGFCLLTSVTGMFQGDGEQVRVYVDDDGFWYLGGKSAQRGVAGECAVIRYPAPAAKVRTLRFPEDWAGPIPDQPQTEAEAPVKILAASYSFGGDFVDVTARVRELVDRNETFQANPGSLGADPHPYWNKALVIFCEVRGKRALFSTGENGGVSRDIILEQARPLTPGPAPAPSANRPWTLMNIEDCSLTQRQGQIQLGVPGTLHSRYPGDGKNNAPAVLTPVTGDFMVEVCVSGNFYPGPEPARDMPRPFSYHGAGLEVYLDKDNFIQLHRGEMCNKNDPKALYWSPAVQQNLGGKFDGFLGYHHPTADRIFRRDDTWLRLVKKGHEMEAYVSDDGGDTWNGVAHFAALPARTVLVGVSVANGSAQPFNGVFGGLKITPLAADADW